MLTYGSEYLARRHLYKLSLVHAAVYSLAVEGVIRSVAQRIKVQLAETGPRLAVIVRNSHVGHVAVREHIVPYAVGRSHLRKRSGVAPEENQASVGQTAESGHRYGPVEARWLRLAPCQPSVGRKSLVVAVLRRAHDHP